MNRADLQLAREVDAVPLAVNADRGERYAEHVEPEAVQLALRIELGIGLDQDVCERADALDVGGAGNDGVSAARARGVPGRPAAGAVLGEDAHLLGAVHELGELLRGHRRSVLGRPCRINVSHEQRSHRGDPREDDRSPN